MPVVINEFEVVPETAEMRGTQPAAPENEAGHQATREQPDLARLLAEERMRAERVRAT